MGKRGECDECLERDKRVQRTPPAQFEIRVHSNLSPEGFLSKSFLS